MKFISPEKLKLIIKTHKYKQEKVKNLKIGDLVIYNNLNGVVGEIKEDKSIYLWHNNANADGGQRKDPIIETNGKYNYSYCLSPDNIVRAIKLIDLKPPTKEEILKSIKENLI